MLVYSGPSGSHSLLKCIVMQPHIHGTLSCYVKVSLYSLTTKNQTVITECQSEESRLHNNPGVTSVTVSDSSIDYSYLFNFDDTERYYCGPTNTRPFNMTISYSSPVLLREIGIHGHNRTFQSDEYVNSFSLSFSKDRDNFTEYIRDTGSTVCYINNIHFYMFAYQFL